MTNNELKEMEEFFNEIYVRQKECVERQEAINKKLANDDKRIALVIKDLELMKKIGMAILTTAVGQLVIAFFDFIK